MILTRPLPWMAVGGVLPNPMVYTIATSADFLEIEIYAKGFFDNSFDLVAGIKQRQFAGIVQVDVSTRLQALFSPVKVAYAQNIRVSLDFDGFAEYYIRYKEPAPLIPLPDVPAPDWVSDEQQTRMAVRAAMPELDGDYAMHLITSTEANWQFDLSTVRCVQQAPRTLSNTEAQMRDYNPASATYNQLRDNGAYYAYGTDAVMCEIGYVNTYPKWEFEYDLTGDITALRCEGVDFSTRENSRRVGIVRDTNINSPTFGQWGEGIAATYGTPNRENASWFYYDTNPTECPLPIPQETGTVEALNAEYKKTEYGPLRVLFRRYPNTTNEKEIGGTFGIYKGSVQFGPDESFRILSGQNDRVQNLSLGLNMSDGYTVRVKSIATNGYTTVNTQNPIIFYVDEFTI